MSVQIELKCPSQRKETKNKMRDFLRVYHENNSLGKKVILYPAGNMVEA